MSAASWKEFLSLPLSACACVRALVGNFQATLQSAAGSPNPPGFVVETSAGSFQQSSSPPLPPFERILIWVLQIKKIECLYYKDYDCK